VLLKEGAMLTAYLDEAGQEGREDVIIAGYIGSDEAWDKLLIKWKAALYPRKSVHVRTLRWNGRRAPRLMAKLGPIPDECGLQRVIGHVRVADYADLFTELQLRKLVPGYQMALHALINSVLRWIPKHEQVRFYFEQQDVFARQQHVVLTAYSQMPCFKMDSGQSQLAGWAALPKGTYFEPADALAYTVLQYARDPRSERFKVCSPFMGNRWSLGARPTRAEVRAAMQLTKQWWAAYGPNGGSYAWLDRMSTKMPEDRK
jgi:hypothetical protein